MFLEPANIKHRGSIAVICGSMFSGKTEELIRRLNRAEIEQLKVCLLYTSEAADDMTSIVNVTSHNTKNKKDV